MKTSEMFSLCIKLCAVQCLVMQIVQSAHLPLLRIGNMEDILTEERIMPDVVKKAPFYIAEITYTNNTIVTFGNKIPKNISENEPHSVRWVPDCHKYYTLIVIDADAFPKHSLKERQLWIVGNIVGFSLETADKLTDYAGPEPEKGTGPHRIVFVIFEQKDIINFKEPKISMPYDNNRDNFSTLNFAKKYNFGDPNAANFFTAEWGV